MAKKKKHHKKRGFTIPIAVVAGAGVGLGHIINAIQEGGFAFAMQKLAVIYLGYSPVDGKFNLSWMRSGTWPLAAGIGAHIIASKLGVNRALARVIPVLRF